MLLLVLTLSLVSLAPVASTDAGEAANGLVLTIKEVAQSGRVVLDIGNVSGRPIRLWKESNSWGAARWRVLRLRGERLDTFYENPDQDFLLNPPQLVETRPGERVVRALDLNAGNWCAFGRCTKELERRTKDQSVSLESGDVTIVIYDVPDMPPLSHQLKAWYGVIAASTTVR